MLVLAISSFFTGMGLNLLIISVLAGGPSEVQVVGAVGTIINSFIAFGVYGELREKDKKDS